MHAAQVLELSLDLCSPTLVAASPLQHGLKWGNGKMTDLASMKGVRKNHSSWHDREAAAWNRAQCAALLLSQQCQRELAGQLGMGTLAPCAAASPQKWLKVHDHIPHQTWSPFQAIIW